VADTDDSLAYCELYVMCAKMVMGVLPRARLVDTTVEDISYDHDLIVLQTKKGSISVKVEIE
jgi:tetrahydromethanopterin S-methyltransferase subunit F